MILGPFVATTNPILVVYWEPCQTSKMEVFAKIVNRLQPLTIFGESSILDFWQGSKYPFAFYIICKFTVTDSLAGVIACCRND